MSIDFDKLFHDMLEAAKNSLKDDWDLLTDDAKNEFEELANRGRNIARKLLEGEITKEEAETLLAIQENTIKIKLQKFEVSLKVACEKAINAALDVFWKAVGL
jgi:FixJ family two-component response regulator